MGSPDPYGSTFATYFLKPSDFVKVSYPDLFVFIDVHEDYLDTSQFSLDWDFNLNTWWHLPASRHGRNGILSFKDGHVEIHRWKDPRTFQPATGSHRGSFPNGMVVNGSPDWRYVKSRLTKGTAAFGDP